MRVLFAIGTFVPPDPLLTLPYLPTANTTNYWIMLAFQ